MSNNKNFQKKYFREQKRVAFVRNFEDYCTNTTIHGLKYVGLSDLNLFERFVFESTYRRLYFLLLL